MLRRSITPSSQNAASQDKKKLSTYPVNHLLAHFITSRNLVQFKEVLRNSSIDQALAPLPWSHSGDPYAYGEEYQGLAHFNYMHTVTRFPRLMNRDLTILHVLCVANCRGKLDASAKKILKATLGEMSAADIYVPCQVFFLIGQLPRIELKIPKFLWAHNLQLIYKTTIETSATLSDYGDEHIWTILSATIEGIMTRYDDNKSETVIPLVKMFCDSMRCSFHFFVEVAVFRHLPKLFTFLLMDYQHSAENLRHFLEVCIAKGNVVLAEIVFVKAGVNASQVLFCPTRIERGLHALIHEESIPERRTPVSFDDMRRWLDFKLELERPEDVANQDPSNTAATDDARPNGRVRSWLRKAPQPPEPDNSNPTVLDAPNPAASANQTDQSSRPAGEEVAEKGQTQRGRLLQRRQRLMQYMRRWTENKFPGADANQNIYPGQVPAETRPSIIGLPDMSLCPEDQRGGTGELPPLSLAPEPDVAYPPIMISDTEGEPSRQERQQRRITTVSQELRRWAEYKISTVRGSTPRSSNVDPIAPVEEGVQSNENSRPSNADMQHWLAGEADAAAIALDAPLSPDGKLPVPDPAAGGILSEPPTLKAGVGRFGFMAMGNGQNQYRRWLGRKLGPFAWRPPDVVYNQAAAFEIAGASSVANAKTARSEGSSIEQISDQAVVSGGEALEQKLQNNEPPPQKKDEVDDIFSAHATVETGKCEVSNPDTAHLPSSNATD